MRDPDPADGLKQLEEAVKKLRDAHEKQVKAPEPAVGKEDERPVAPEVAEPPKEPEEARPKEEAAQPPPKKNETVEEASKEPEVKRSSMELTVDTLIGDLEPTMAPAPVERDPVKKSRKMQMSENFINEDATLHVIPRDGGICYQGTWDRLEHMLTRVRASPYRTGFKPNQVKISKGGCKDFGYDQEAVGGCYPHVLHFYKKSDPEPKVTEDKKGKKYIKEYMHEFHRKGAQGVKEKYMEVVNNELKNICD